MYLFGKTRKLISWLLVAVMLIGMFPMGAFAVEAEDPTAPLAEPVAPETTAAPETTETPETEAPAQAEAPETEPPTEIVSEEAQSWPGGGYPGGGSSIYSHTFKHIDVRIQSARLAFTYTVYDIDGNVDPDASYTENVECNVTKVEYVVVNGTTYTGFSQSGTYEWRKTRNVSIQVNDSSTATIVCDLVSKDGSKTYNDVEISYGFAGIKAAAENCDGYRNGRYDGLDFDVAKIDSYTIHMEAVSIAGEKIWNDGDNQDGIRPKSITIHLLANGKVIDTKTVTAAEGWKYDFGRLPKTDQNGKEINYEIREVSVPGYTTSFDGNNIVNTHTPSFTSLCGSKTWDDNNNQDGKRPDSITIHLLANGKVVATKTVTASDNWRWSFTELPKYACGKAIVYTIREDPVDGYTTSYCGYDVKNTRIPEKTCITICKRWEDANDQDGKRPDSVTVKLLANGADTGKTLTLTAPRWSGAFSGLPKYENGVEIVYNVEEVPVPGYTTTYNGYTIINTHVPETTTVSGAKTWEDNNNQDGTRPESITIHLLANGKVVATKTVTEADGWAWSFENLPKYVCGKLITYSITEETVKDYTTTYNGYNVVNTHAPAKTSITVTKAWADGNDQDGIRPNDITVVLVKNGQPTEQTLVLSSGNSWTSSFTGLPVYENGTAIVYTIQELTVEGYTSAITGDASAGFTITNSHTPEVVKVEGSKTWIDNDNQDGKRPGSITIHLLANGEVADTITVTEADGWAWSFQNLPKNKDGQPITYSITEEAVEDYTATYNGYNVKNAYTPAETSVSVTKAWADSSNQDGIRPNTITVVLLANGEDTGKTLVLSSGNSWTGSFTGLPVYENGTAIVYTIQELTVEGYTSAITGDASAGFTITNSHTPEVVKVEGSKTWIDNDNQDGKRPGSITIHLLANGEVIDTITVTEADGWAWSFADLPKYEDGKQITYSITETAVEGYTAKYNGYDVTNTHTPAETSISVSKAWVDSNNQDGIRPNDITVELYAGGAATGKTLVLSSGNSWTGSFTGLPAYKDGKDITYTVKEADLAEGYTAVITGTAAEGYTITNTHTPETIAIEGAKTWDDSNDQDGKRPESITIHLLANGEVKQTITVTEADGWAWSFTDLPKYENGKEIVYSITEDTVEDYSTEYNGYNVVNTYAPAKTSVTVTKAWDDSNDQDGIRPGSITVVLLADGEETGEELSLSAGNNWTGSFTELDKYAAGVEIEYTVEEIAIDGYSTVIIGDAATGFTITNSHSTETVEVSGRKYWVDGDDRDGLRPDSITIHLLANGEVADTITVTEADGWAWRFVGLPKYENGVEIEYAISEDGVEDYKTSYNGYDVYNEHDPENINISVRKVWKDSDDADDKRPNSITVYLYADGKLVETVKITAADGWKHTFENLPRYADGEKIKYTIEEKDVDGYNTVISGSASDGFTITNSRTTSPKTGDNRNSLLWTGILLASACLFVVALVPFKKRRTTK